MRRFYSAFTLAELLIALLILGVIATFTIPKVLNSQAETKRNAVAKETYATVFAVGKQLKDESKWSSSTTFADFTPYLNYVAVITTISTTVDYVYSCPSTGTLTCSGGFPCLRLHNGALVRYSASATVASGTAFLVVDADGVSQSGNADSLGLSLHDGLPRFIKMNEDDNYWVVGLGCANQSPPWFKWST